jgi:hypothetical protein
MNEGNYNRWFHFMYKTLYKDGRYVDSYNRLHTCIDNKVEYPSFLKYLFNHMTIFR